MIQMRTILEVADNSGAKKISCIHLRGGSQGQYAELGDVITANVKDNALLLEVIAGAGHLSNLERPAAFNHLVSEFLAQLTLE